MVLLLLEELEKVSKEVSHIPDSKRISVDLPKVFSVFCSGFALQFLLNSKSGYFRTKQT